MSCVRLIQCVLLVALAIFLQATVASAYAVTLNGYDVSYLTTLASGGEFPRVRDEEEVYPATLPYSYDSTAVAGGSSVIAKHELSNTSFTISFDHARSSEPLSTASSRGQVFFSVNQNVDYALAGSYAAADPDGTWFELSVILYDITLDKPMLYSQQHSNSTPNESFTLGLMEGDQLNELSGSMAGTLIAGHDYSFFYMADIVVFQTEPSAEATASGFASLTLVPEPSRELLLMTTLLTLACVQRFRA